MSDFSRLLEAGRVTDEELFKHLIFFEKQVGISFTLRLEDIWSTNRDREKVKQELVSRQLIGKAGLEALSNALINLGKEEGEHSFFTKERR